MQSSLSHPESDCQVLVVTDDGPVGSSRGICTPGYSHSQNRAAGVVSSLKDGSDFPVVPKRPCRYRRQARRKVYLSPPMLFLPPVIVENKFLPHPECPALWEERGNITHSPRPNTCCVKASGGEDILESALGKG